MRIRVGHVSLQFSDTSKQHTQDIEKVFDRAKARRFGWLTGTEAGPGSGNIGEELVRIGQEHGYKMWVPEIQSKTFARHADAWIAVRKDLVRSDSWKPGFERVIPGSQELYSRIDKDPDSQPRWGPKGLVHVSFSPTVKGLGKVSIGAAHYLSKSRSPATAVHNGVDHWEWNEKLAKAIGKWAGEQGKGRALVFYGGDQNIVDRTRDTFFGEDLTSTWDELRHWESTGHDNIDVIATFNKDGRVSALRTTALDDKEFFLHGDHFFVEAVLAVKPLS